MVAGGAETRRGGRIRAGRRAPSPHLQIAIPRQGISITFAHVDVSAGAAKNRTGADWLEAAVLSQGEPLPVSGSGADANHLSAHRHFRRQAC